MEYMNTKRREVEPSVQIIEALDVSILGKVNGGITEDSAEHLTERQLDDD